jgi:hypothetical protein
MESFDSRLEQNGLLQSLIRFVRTSLLLFTLHAFLLQVLIVILSFISGIMEESFEDV